MSRFRAIPGEYNSDDILLDVTRVVAIKRGDFRIDQQDYTATLVLDSGAELKTRMSFQCAEQHLQLEAAP